MVTTLPLMSVEGSTSIPATHSRSFEGLNILKKSWLGFNDGNSGPSSMAVCGCCCLSILHPSISRISNPTQPIRMSHLICKLHKLGIMNNCRRLEKTITTYDSDKNRDLYPE